MFREQDECGGVFFRTNSYWNSSHEFFNRKECIVAQMLATSDKRSIMAFSQYHAGPGQILFGSSKSRHCDFMSVRPGGVWNIYQYHEDGHVLETGHESGCPKYAGVDVRYNEKTTSSDVFNYMYAGHLSRHTPLTISYNVLNECFTHHLPMRHLKRQEKIVTDDNYVTLPAWMDGENKISEEDLLEKILHDGNETDGYVVIKGGRETRRDQASLTTGFCLVRDTVSTDELGPSALHLTEREVRRRKCESLEGFQTRKRKRALDLLKRRGENKFSLLRRGFGDKTVCLPVSHFRWLVNERGLRDFELIHFYRYASRDYLRDFVLSVLQERHTLTLEGKKDGLMASILKLFLNSCYGFTLMDPSRFTTHSFASESSLKSGLSKQRNDIKNLTVIGVTRRKRKYPELYYMIERGRESAKIRNLCQFGGAVLGWSRVVFYSHMLKLLNCLDPKKAHLVYCDTDSQVWHLARSSLFECVLPEKKNQFNKIRDEIFADEKAPECSPGLMKVEGFFKYGIFRAAKTYFLEGFKEGEICARAKGIPHKIQKRMEHGDYSLSENDDRQKFYRSFALTPTVGGEIAITVRERKTTNMVNMKRRMAKVNFLYKIGVPRFLTEFFFFWCCRISFVLQD